MKLNAGNVSVWALVASLALAGILFGKSATSVFATCSQGFHWNGQQCVPNEVEVDECNEEFTYDNQVDDNRVLIDTINTGASGNPDSITVTAKSGYQVIGVNLELDDNNTSGWDVQLGAGDLSSYNPQGTDIEDFEVIVKKVCEQEIDVCSNLDGNQPTMPQGYHYDNEDQCVPDGTPAPQPTPLSCGSDQHLDAGGVNCVTFAVPGEQVGSAGPSGQVLGASTMAKTGSFAESLNLAIMALGGALSALGIKNFKKASKKA